MDVSFERLVFKIAGVYGALILLPMYFLEGRIGAEVPPRITHVEFYYGFLGVALVWQAAFLVIGSDPVRFRPIIPAAIMEKFVHVIGMAVLWQRGGVAAQMMPPVLVDFAFGVLFVMVYQRTRPVARLSALASSRA